MTIKRSARTAVLACAGLAAMVLLVGASPAAAKTKFKKVTSTFNQCQNVSQALGDHSLTQVAFTVPKTPKGSKPRGGRVLSVASVGLRLTHSYDGDVSVYLLSPSGQIIPLALGRGGSDDDFGTGSTDCNGTLTLFSDTAGAPIGEATAPFAGSFKPEAQLSGLIGGTASGRWTVLVVDTQTSDTGTVNAASLNLTYQYKKPKK